MAREGRRIATLFRQARELRETRSCDLERLLEQDQLEVVDSKLIDPGYTACLIRSPEGYRGGIISLAKGQDVGRRRFSIAHELGHYHIPKHAKQTSLPCAESDLRTRSTDSRQVEAEANDFAAELLMPFRLFSLDVDRRDASFDSVLELAGPEFYNVSATAAAWRLVQTTSEACALIVSVNGVVEWTARSKAFRGFLPERRQRVGFGTAAAAVFAGESAIRTPEKIEWHEWLERDPGSDVELWESTHAVPTLGQVLSLVWSVSDYN